MRSTETEQKKEYKARCLSCGTITTFSAGYSVQQYETYDITKVHQQQWWDNQQPGSQAQRVLVDPSLELGDKTDERGTESHLEGIICNNCGHEYLPKDFYTMVGANIQAPTRGRVRNRERRRRIRSNFGGK